LDPVLSHGWLLTGGMVLARMSGLVMSLPVFSLPGMPVMPKAIMVLVLTTVVAPVVGTGEIPVTFGHLLFGMGGELVLGIIIGGMVKMVFSALHIATEVIATQIGHGAAAMFDPMTQATGNPLGTMANLLAGAVFVGVDLHLILMAGVADSFALIPPGGVVDPISAGKAWTETANMVILAGAQMAAPILALTFMVNLFVSVLTRLAPSMNVFFSMGLVLTCGCGLLLFYLGLPNMLVRHQRLLNDAMLLIPNIFRHAAGLP